MRLEDFLTCDLGVHMDGYLSIGCWAADVNRPYVGEIQWMESVRVANGRTNTTNRSLRKLA